MSSGLKGLTWQNSWQKRSVASSGEYGLSFRAVVKPWNRSLRSSIACRVSYSFSVSPSAIFTTITTAYAQMLRRQPHTRTRTQGGRGEHTVCCDPPPTPRSLTRQWNGHQSRSVLQRPLLLQAFFSLIHI